VEVEMEHGRGGRGSTVRSVHLRLRVLIFLVPGRLAARCLVVSFFFPDFLW
jgi:hypothetical protein